MPSSGLKIQYIKGVTEPTPTTNRPRTPSQSLLLLSQGLIRITPRSLIANLVRGERRWNSIGMALWPRRDDTEQAPFTEASFAGPYRPRACVPECAVSRTAVAG